jgi:parallel beta-helix repeat protein
MALLLMLLNAAPLLAQKTIHVPGDASTIQGGIDLAKNSDTVLVAPGTYNENIDFKGKSITITSGATSFASAAQTILNATGDGPAVTFDSGETTSAVLNGFTIQGGHTDVSTCTYGGGVYVFGASPTISNNAIINNANYGIYVAGQASPIIEGNDVRGNYFSDAGQTTCGNRFTGVSALGRGIYLTDTVNPQLTGNTIENNNCAVYATNSSSACLGAGIYVIRAQNLLLKNNIIRNNVADGEPGIAGPFQTMVTQSFVMVQNLVYGNESSTSPAGVIGVQVYIGGATPAPILTEINNTIFGGEALISSFGPSVIANNIFANPSPGPPGPLDFNGGLMCIDSNSANSPLVIQNNDSYIAGETPTFPCNMGAGNIYVDPGFRDSENGDFHEQDTSPTVATGDMNTQDIPNADLDNKARTVCNTIDMGVYELRPHPPVAISSSANPTPGGSPVTFTVQVTGNCNTPTGKVAFYDGSSLIGTSMLNSSGITTFTTSLLVVGQHKMTAQYSGDFNFESNTSDVLIQTITGDPTSTSLSVSPNPATAFSPITLVSKVTSQYGTPTGSVTFTAGETTAATVPLNASGQAATTVTTLGAGTYQIVANYTADTRFQPSSSFPVVETVVGANSSTTLTSTPNPSALTQAVTLTAIVHPTQGNAIPSGSVTFADGSTVLGTIALDANGTASLTTSALSLGTHFITARYLGSNNFNPSSATISQAVTLIATSLTLTATPNPANNGQSVQIVATATSAVAGMLPVGTVTFYDGNSILGTADIGEKGSASFSTSGLSVGTHTLHAVLAGSAYFAGSSSPDVNEVVQAYDFSLALSKTSLSIPSGDYSNISMTVTPIGGFHGSVSLLCSGLPDYALCVFPQGSTVSLADGAKTVTLSVNTADVYGYGNRVSNSALPKFASGQRVALAVVLLPSLSLFGLLARRRKVFTSLHLMGIAIGMLATMCFMNGCGSKQPSKAAPGTYSLTVTGTSSGGTTLSHSVPLQLTITK